MEIAVDNLCAETFLPNELYPLTIGALFVFRLQLAPRGQECGAERGFRA
jgi:hypothetical protein